MPRTKRKNSGGIQNRANRLNTMATYPPESGGHTKQREPVKVKFEKAHPSHPGKEFVAARGKRAHSQEVPNEHLIGTHHDNLRKRKSEKPK